VEFHDPAIMEHGALPPVGAGTNGWMSHDRWELRIPALNLHDQHDQDYFRIPLPDPASLFWTGYPDIDPDASVIEPMLECGESSRRSFESGRNDVLHFHGALTLAIGRNDPSGSEQIILNGAPERGFTSPLPCPRSELNLQEVLVGYGSGLRDQVVTYDMTLYYGVGISRLPSAIPSSWGKSLLAGLPCPGGGVFPQCDLRVTEIATLNLGHPLNPIDDPSCGPLDCRTAILFEWMEAGEFLVDVETTGELAFALYDVRGERIAEARPFDTPASVQAAQATEVATRLLRLRTPLEPGLYVLTADGPAGEFTMRFKPAPIPEHRQPGGKPTSGSRVFFPYVKR
jgi:hypothetical protein